jgi:hypothetical protein
MKILFCICEGDHDAQFIRRTLLISGKYKKDKSSVSQYQKPLRDFFIKCFTKQDWESIQIGEPQATLLPATTVKNPENAELILIFKVGGDNRLDLTFKLLDIVFNLSDPAVRKILSEGGDNEYSILFVFDADDMGKENRRLKFCEDFNEYFQGLDGFDVETWEIKRGIPLGLFIFTRENSDKGTLEDTLIQLFDTQKEQLVTDSYDLLVTHSDHAQTTVAERAKQAKSVLTICGQTECKNAGYSLAVIIKNCEMLADSLDFHDERKVWSRIVKMVEGAFPQSD